MTNHREPTRSSAIETIALAAELRRAHDFANTAPISLEMPTSPPPLPPLSVTETDFHIESRDDDPPFRPPAIWHTSEPTGQTRSWHWSERSTAAFLGFAAGLLVIVPTVIYLSIENNPQPAAPSAASASKSVPKQRRITQPLALSRRQAAGNPPGFATASSITGRWVDTGPPAGTPQTRLQPAEAVAKRQLGDGQLSEARATLRAAASPDAPKLWFLLAETYDPNHAKLIATSKSPFAVRAARGSIVATNAKFARYYYNQALVHGFHPARQRLDALARRMPTRQQQ